MTQRNPTCRSTPLHSSHLYDCVEEENWQYDGEKLRLGEPDGDDGGQERSHRNQPELNVERQSCVGRVEVRAEVV